MLKQAYIRIKQLSGDASGLALSAELVLFSAICLLGLIVSLTAVRDALLCEVSDVAGAVQDINQSYVTRGVRSGSAVVAGMNFNDGADHCDEANDVVGAADNCIVLSEIPVPEGSPSARTSIVVGNPTTPAARSLDSWRSILVVDRSQTFTSMFTNVITVVAETFSFHSGRSSGLVTPFIVEVLGFNNFEVVAVGDTVVVGMTGDQTHPFSSTPISFPVAPGATLAIGFTDANADGSGSLHSIVRFGPGNPVYLTGGPRSNQAGSVSVGSPPVPGAATFNTLNRTYQFNIGLEIPEE